MSAQSILIADAVVAVLNAASIAGVFAPLTFTATREYIVDIAQESTTLTVHVVPASVATEGGASDLVYDNTVIEIGVFNKVAEATLKTDCDKLVLLCEQIRNHLHSAAGNVVIDGSSDPLETVDPEIDPIYDYEKLRTNKRFSSVVRMTYKPDRGRG